MAFQRRQRELPAEGSRHGSWRKCPYSEAWSRSTSWTCENEVEKILEKETP